MAWSDALAAQYDAATRSRAVVTLDGWTTVRVSGADRARFLHNMCTADVLKLPVGGQCEAFFTDVKGKIVGHVMMFVEAERMLLVTVPGQAAKLIGHLERYVVREDVRLEDDSTLTAWSIAVGPEVRVTERGWACSLLWPGGLWLSGAAGELPDRREAGVAAAVWHALRIESGWPLFGVDFDGSHLPQEVGRDDQAISFRKGCYLGQETIARIDALGHVNKRLATVRLDAEAPPGAELTAAGQSVGALSSVSWSPRLGAWLGLAMVRRGHESPGAQMECLGRPAEVIPTPAVADHSTHVS